MVISLAVLESVVVDIEQKLRADFLNAVYLI